MDELIGDVIDMIIICNLERREQKSIPYGMYALLTGCECEVPLMEDIYDIKIRWR